MKQRIKFEDGIELSTICRQMKLVSSDGKKQETCNKKQNPEVCIAGTTGYYGAKIIHFFNMQIFFNFFMKYEEYETALSKPRIGKYRLACRGDKNKALILYRYNIKLCQKFHGLLGVLEVVLRNAVNVHFKTQLNDNNWLVTQAQTGFLVNYQDIILKELNKLSNRNYSHDKLVASLSLGAWTFLFSRNCYKNSGKTLLRIFPNKTHGLNQRFIYADLDKIRTFHNRIAHHEPLCFDSIGMINVDYVKDVFSLIIKYIDFLGYHSNELLYGVENPSKTIDRIEKLSKTL